jgi:hypothetical protein
MMASELVCYPVFIVETVFDGELKCVAMSSLRENAERQMAEERTRLLLKSSIWRESRDLPEMLEDGAEFERAALGLTIREATLSYASADTHPKDGDATEIAAPLVSGAVPKADAQTSSSRDSNGDSNPMKANHD